MSSAVKGTKGRPPVNAVYGVINVARAMARQIGRHDLADALGDLLPRKGSRRFD